MIPAAIRIIKNRKKKNRILQTARLLQLQRKISHLTSADKDLIILQE